MLVVNGKLQLQSIEYNIVEHCNLRCFGCDHGSPLLPRTFVDLQEYKHDLDTLQRVLHVDELRLIGGEPLLHRDIVDFLRIGTATGVCDRIVVVTNGTLLHKVDNEFWRLIDKLQVTVYPSAQLGLEIDVLEDYKARFGFELDIIHRGMFRHTILAKRIEDAHLVTQIYEQCELRTIYHCYSVRRGRFYKCSVAPFTQDRLKVFDMEYESGTDGVTIHQNPSLMKQLISYLESPTPLPACHYCLGTSGKNFDHIQVDRRETVNWMKSGNPRQLLDARFRFVDDDHIFIGGNENCP